MNSQPILRSICPRNILSFGPETAPIQLRNLNVLIGANGAGKSNLIEVIALLDSTTRDLTVPIREGGGIGEWLWKSGGRTSKRSGGSEVGSIDVLVSPAQGAIPTEYFLALAKSGFNIEVVEERIRSEKGFGTHQLPYLYFEKRGGRAVLNIISPGKKPRQLQVDDIDPRQSVLSQRKDPVQYPELTYIGKQFGRFAFYRDWTFGINSDAREVYALGQQSDYLEEDASNLALVLNGLLSVPETKRRLLDALQLFYAPATDITTPIKEGSVELRIEENNRISTPASRLSDGTLRWLSLLAVLLNPTPPPLTCIEEPELGLHPDIIPELGKLLGEAASRTQLIVTTHSHALVESFNDDPESVCVCEKPDGETQIRRLESDKLSSWLEKYSLGQLWAKGEIGGNRW
jgi:predicted ATPase